MGEDAVQTEFDEYSLNTDVQMGLDLLPEHCRYRDEGCELASSCLNCPFPECVFERPGGRKRWQKEGRSAEMARLYTTEGKGISELAERFGVSSRTVRRDLKAVLNDYNRRVKNV